MTIKDVAKYSNVSVSTVSRVLNNHPDVSREVRERVLNAAAKLHYIPNSSARDLVRPQSDAIGLVVKGVGNIFFSELIRSIELEVNKAGYTMVLHHINTDENELREGAALVRSKKLRGLIFLGGKFNYTDDEAALIGIPFVCCSYNNKFGTLSPENYSSVSIDDENEAYKAVSILLDNGHRDIATLLSATDDKSISELRYRGYARALKERGIAGNKKLIAETGNFHMDTAYRSIKKLIDSGIKFTAIFAISDSMAMAAIKALHDNGISVPDKCSVISIDGIEVSEYIVPTLTTMVQPKEKMGHEAVNILLGLIDSNMPNKHLQLEAKLREGESVRSPVMKHAAG